MTTGSPTASTDSTFGLSPQQACLLRVGGPAPLTAQCAVLIEGVQDDGQLQSALSAIVAEHEVLRSTFPTPPEARAPVGQTVHDRLEPTWVTLAVATRDPTRDAAALRALLRSETDATAAPDVGPLLRVACQDLGGGRRLLVLTALAACADAVSLAAVGAQIAAGVAGSDPEPLQHADYAQWRAELIAGDDPEAARGRAFWSDATEGLDATSALPVARTAASDPDRPAALAEFPLTVSDSLREAINAVGGELGADPDVVVEAAWAALLARVLGVEEILLASLADGRAQPDLHDAIGPYAQAVPVRVRIGPQTRLAEVLDQVKRARGDAARFENYGSDAALRVVLERSAAGFAALPAGLPGVVALRSAVPTTRLGLVWHGSGGGFWADLAVADANGLKQLAGWLETLLHAAGSNPSAMVSQLALLDPAARELTLTSGKGRPAAAAGPRVHVAFEDQSARTPDLPAVSGAGVTLSFAELNARANRLAHHLADAGAQPGAPVAMCLSRTPELIVSLLAILKTGAPYLPLNPGHPAERLAHQLRESGAGLVITEAGLIDRIPHGESVVIVAVDRDAEAIGERADTNPGSTGAPDDLAYVMYTSGSTGTPKGVAVTHANLAAYTAAISEQLGTGEGLQFAVVSEISTDLGNTAIFPPLTSGGCIHLIDPDTAMDGTAFAAQLATQPLDVLKITPTHLRALLAAADGVLPRKWLIVGGEALSWELVERIRAAGPTCRILNHYGPTETTVGCCTYELPADTSVVAGSSATVPVGRPLPGERAYILDRHLEPVPNGVAGELCIGGDGVARGYVNRPDATAERFVPAPDGSGTMYRTGDRARFLADGEIEFLGRIDDQVKIRGFRVEPGEIEAALLRQPTIREAAVVARPAADGELALIAFVVGSPVSEPDELRAALGHSLPEHMVPGRIVAIESMPLTASGKIDRPSLPDPGTIETQRSAAFVAPRDDLEREIAAIWCDLLGVDEVGVTDDFFALGGHSLLATQAIMRARRIYGDIPLAAMFNAPTVAALADAIRERLEAAP
jgi:amino acid adenylation domain-containing protein